MPLLDYQLLYRMEDPLATRPIRLTECEGSKLELDWNTAVGLLKGEFLPSQPIRLCPAMGGEFTDLMWSTLLHITVISRRVVDLLTSFGCTGWATYPVEVYDRQGQVAGEYYGLAITGKTGKPDFRRSEIIEKPPITSKGKPYKVFKGMYFENDNWDGRDLCLIGGTTFLVVTEKVVRTFKRAKIRNVEFVPLPKVELNISEWESKGQWPPKNEITA